MRLHYKAGQLALYGSGDTILIATSEGQNRVSVFDSRAVFTLTWEDKLNKDCSFSVSVNRREFLNLLRKGRPRNDLYELRISQQRGHLAVFDHALLAENSDPVKGFIGSVSFQKADINSVKTYYQGLMIEKDVINGSICMDFDQLKYVMDFLNNYVSAGRYGNKEIRVVNFQTTNEMMPLLCQAFVKCNQTTVFDLDVAIFPFIK